MKIIFLSLFLLVGTSLASYESRLLKCQVCQAVIQAMKMKVDNANPYRRIQVGGYSVDPSGNLKSKSISYARSEMHLSEVMEDVCDSMQDYARATNKATGKLEILKLVTDEGMNPRINEVDLIQDSDLNKSLVFHCRAILEEYEDFIVDEFKKTTPNPVDSVCTDVAKFCDEAVLNDEL